MQVGTGTVQIGTVGGADRSGATTGSKSKLGAHCRYSEPITITFVRHTKLEAEVLLGARTDR